MLRTSIIVAGLLALFGNQSVCETKQVVPPHDVIIGTPKPIPYSRAFPLLDGIFQDVAAVQLKQLVLDPNTANTSNLNAILQQFQLSVQYSQTAGLQNAAAAQQTAVNSASAVLQTQLITQQTQLIGLEQAAQQQVGKAQVSLDSLPTTATSDQKAAGQQTLALANDNLNSINAQLANVKGLLATSPQTPSFNPVSPSLPGSIQSPPVPITPPGGNSFSPSFPASKQMDNQVNLLWERLARLVSTLAQTDDPRYTGIFLVEFHTGVSPGKGKRKHQLLSTQYTLGCSAGTDDPRVLDLFPRSAAVNITDEKYKDSRLGLSALISFFSVGFNAAYNREHLQITQALGQSAYTTGFGIGTRSFGWVFGPTLGEDAVSPGDRPTFALVAAPESCGTATISLAKADWNKSPITTDEHPISVPVSLKSWNTSSAAQERCTDCVARVSYTPADFDPLNQKPIAVTLDINLKTDLDREDTVNIDGIFLRRARDTFGRATTGAGTGGLLESASLDINTWIPISSKELILTLDASVFSRQFPSILLNSPTGSIDVTAKISGNTQLDVAGRVYKCDSGPAATCTSVLPPVGRPKATPKQFAVARWAGSSADKDRLCITVSDTAAPATNSVSSSTIPALQVITDSRTQMWSAHSKVTAIQGGLTVPLRCEPRGERLVCNAGNQLDRANEIRFEIFDSGYSGGSAIKGSGVLEGCSGTQCYEPLIWQMNPPKWDSQNSLWIFHVTLINVQDKQVATLGKLSGTSFTSASINCAGTDLPCQADIPILKSQFGFISDVMSLQVMDTTKTSEIGFPTVIGNLGVAVSPLLSYISDDQTHFSGQNLVFDNIQVGPSGSKIKTTCAEGIDCFISGFGPKDDGYLYFATGSKLLAFMIATDKGIQVVPAHHPQKPAAAPVGNTPDKSAAQAPSSTTPAQQILKNPSLQMFSIK